MERATPILELIATSIELIGIAILVYAAIRFIAHFLAFEIKRLRGLECVLEIRSLRMGLGSYILLSLEFIIISDIIMTTISMNLDDLLALGLLVMIRIVLSFFLGRELIEVKSQD
jgi:uncharacterized membrane protein